MSKRSNFFQTRVGMVRMVELNVSAADVLQCMCAHVYLLVPSSVYMCCYIDQFRDQFS